MWGSGAYSYCKNAPKYSSEHQPPRSFDLQRNKTTAWHSCFELDSRLIELDLCIEHRTRPSTLQPFVFITTLYAMSKGGVPDAWDDDWERLADVSMMYMEYTPRGCVIDDFHRNLNLNSQ